MTGAVSPVDINSNATFGTLILAVNNLVTFVNTEAMSVNQTANGAITSGNAFVNGVVSATTLAANTIRGGNNTSNAALLITGDVYSNSGNLSAVTLTANTLRGGNNATASTLNVEGNVNFDATTLFIDSSANRVGVMTGGPNATFTVNGTSTTSTSSSVGANNISNTTANFIGNSTVNSITTSASVVLANSTVSATLSTGTLAVGNTTGNVTVNTTSVSVGANARLSTTDLFVGNTTANLVANSILVKVANSTATANISPLGLVVGTTTVNTIAVGIGANVIIGTTAMFVGNSTANSTQLSTQIQIANSTGTTNVNPAGVAVGTTVVNSTAVAATTGAFTSLSGNLTVGTTVVNTTAIGVGANVILTTADVRIGNSTVNAFANSVLLRVANSTASANIAPNSLTIGTTVANTTGFAAGSNVLITTADVRVGNSTVNAFSNSSQFIVQSATFNTVISPASVNLSDSGGTTQWNTNYAGIGAISPLGDLQIAADFIILKSTPGGASNVGISYAGLAVSNSTANVQISPSYITVGSQVTMTNTNITFGNSVNNTAITSASVRTGNTLLFTNVQVGQLTLSRNTGSPFVVLTGNTAVARYFGISTDNNPRWRVGGNATAESGSDAGSDFEVTSFSDANTANIRISGNRATGVMTFQNNIVVSATTPHDNSALTRKDYVDTGDVWVKISSNNFATFPAGITLDLPSGYDVFRIHVTSVRPTNAGGSQRLVMQVSQDGSTFLNAASDYIYQSHDTVNTTLTVTRVTTGNGFTLTPDLNDGSFLERCDGYIEFYTPGAATIPARIKTNLSGTEETTLTDFETRVNGRVASNGAILKLNFFSSGANMAIGVLTLTGFKA